MITQVELQSGQDLRVYWLSHQPYQGEILEEGRKVVLLENSNEWTIRRLLVNVPDDFKIGVPHRVGTILQLL